MWRWQFEHIHLEEDYIRGERLEGRMVEDRRKSRRKLGLP